MQMNGTGTRRPRRLRLFRRWFGRRQPVVDTRSRDAAARSRDRDTARSQVRPARFYFTAIRFGVGEFYAFARISASLAWFMPLGQIKEVILS
jgi:hypothetical protein